MRRNPRGGRGNQNWQMQRQNPPRMSDGPMMTDHLGLQDIDKELQLLKRKREIIEQQQKILANEFRRNDYQEPQYSQSSRFDDYAQLYDDMHNYDPPSRKRPIAVWEDDIPTKRFSGPTRIRTRAPQRSGPTNRGGYQGSQPRQPFRPPTGPVKSRPQPKKDFPPKAAKNTAAPINKLNTYPVADRKKLITDAINLTSGGSGSSDLNNRLRSDCEPSKQVTGRLELALGSIIKDIRVNADSEALKSQAVIRHIKKTVRDRIREVMMDRVVGSGESVKARYREIYKEQSDYEVVSNAIDAIGGEVTLLKIADPELYFKTNMHKIMQLKLQSLLQKLEETYRAEFANPPTTAQSEKEPYETKTVEQSEKNTDETSAIKTEEKKQGATENKDTLDETIINTEKYRTLDKLMTNKMVSMIKKFVPYIMKLMDIDTKFSKLKNTITSETVKMLMQNEEQQINECVDSPDVSMRSLNPSYNTTPKNNTTPKAPYKPLPYFAKLMGKPGLPKRHHMEKFFEEFQPKSIKKHRTVHNLLFVGFVEKENFDKLLAADGTVIGKYTLSIRVSERSNPEAKKELDTSISSEDKIIGPELDEQITDLLTSIRKAEESDACENGTEGETEVKDDENTGTGEDAANNADGGYADTADSVNADYNYDPNAPTGDMPLEETYGNEDILQGNEDILQEGNENMLQEGNEDMLQEGNEDMLQEGNGDMLQENSNAEEAEAVDQVPSDVKPLGQATPVTRARSSARLASTPR